MKSKRVYVTWLIPLTFLMFSNIYGQILTPNSFLDNSEEKNYVIIGSYQMGSVYNKEAYLSGKGNGSKYKESFQSFSLKFGNQTNGSKDWQVAHNYPLWGGGIHIFDFYAPDDLGTPIVVYGFISSALRKDRFALRYEIEAGVSFNWSPYNAIDNPNNKAIGSKVNAYLGGGAFLEYNVSNRITANAGFSFNHFSCGSTVQPNRGINIISPRINVKYNLFNTDINYSRRKPLIYDEQNELILTLFTSVRNFAGDVTKLDSTVNYNRSNYRVHGMTANLVRQISHKSKIGLGISVSYDNSCNAKETKCSWEKDLQLSFYPSYEIVFSDLSIIIQPGIYLHRNRSSYRNPNFYQRIGLKYHFFDNAFFGVSLRAYNFQVSDYIEWTIGYRINWKD